MKNSTPLKSAVDLKVEEAKEVILKSKTADGFYASNDTYRYEYWTRDFSLCVDQLLEMGYCNSIRNHLNHIWERQNEKGEVPTLVISDRPAWYAKYVARAIKNRRIPNMLKKHIGIEFLNPWAVDSTPLAVISSYKYLERTHDRGFWDSRKENINEAIRYVESQTRKGLLYGADWRDEMKQLRNRAILSNQVLLYEMYKKAGEKDSAEKTRTTINKTFWNGEYYVDFKGRKNFDVLGTSLGVLSGVVPEERYESLIPLFSAATSRHGMRNVLIIGRMNSHSPIADACDQYSTIWPFVAGYAILALKKTGRKDFATSEFNKLTALSGFSEWYDAKSGEPKGSEGQLWSAALYLKAFAEIQKRGYSKISSN